MENAVCYTADKAKFSARIGDLNGWFEVKRNPISRVGVFDYLGASLPGAPDPNALYRVYRPAEELSDPEFLESLRLLPLIDEHVMLGPEEAGYTPPEDRGVHGIIGEAVEFDGEFVRSNLKIFSDSLARAIDGGKRELSLGYRCVYEWKPGEVNGVRYDAVQRKLRGNHLALVGEGRMGPAVAVLDHNSTFTVDNLEFKTMTDKATNGDGAGTMTVEEALAAFQSLAPLIDQLRAMVNPAPPAGDADPAMPAAKPDEDESKAAALADAVDARNLLAALDSKLGAIGAALDSLAKPAPALDAAEIGRQVREELTKRDDLARRLTPHVGAFDSANMSYAEVAAYGVAKLGLPAPAGSEGVALDAYLHNREAPRPVGRVATVADAGPTSPVGRFLSLTH